MKKVGINKSVINMAGCLVLCVFIIILAACIMPWWYIPVCVLGGILFFLFENSTKSRRYRAKSSKSKKKGYKKDQAQDNTKGNAKANTKTKKTNVVDDTAALLGGAALYHHIKNRHQHDDVRDDIEDYYASLDDDLYGDVPSYDDSDYNEEQAAFDDYLASLDDD